MTKKKQGFAVLDKIRRQEIASLGGKAAHKAGTAHRWTRETAAIAGRKGQEAKRKRRKLKQDSQ